MRPSNIGINSFVASDLPDSGHRATPCNLVLQNGRRTAHQPAHRRFACGHRQAPARKRAGSGQILRAGSPGNPLNVRPVCHRGSAAGRTDIYSLLGYAFLTCSKEGLNDICNGHEQGPGPIPADVRARLGLRPGSRLAFVPTATGYEIHSLSASIKDLKGAVPQPAQPVSTEEMNDAIAAAAAADPT